LFRFTETLEKRRLFRFAEPLQVFRRCLKSYSLTPGSKLRVPSFYAEGSGSQSSADFANFLNIARRSVFEVANILLILSKENYLASEHIQPLLSELEEQSRMLLAFRRRLKS